jgi:hypothetical protein
MKPKAKDYKNIFDYCEALENYIKELEEEIRKLEEELADYS